jgi:hypothetical protein
MTDMAQADRTLRSNLTLFYRTAALQRLERQNHELITALQHLVNSCILETAPDGYHILQAPAQSDIRAALSAIAKAQEFKHADQGI